MYTPLNVKTHNTLLSSMVRIDDLILKAKEYGFSTLGLADQTMYGVMEFYRKCKKNEIQPIIGLEIMVQGFPLVLYVMNERGYQNLLQIHSQLEEDVLDLGILGQYSSDLVCVVPFESHVMYEMVQKLFPYVFQGYSTHEQRKSLMGSDLIYFRSVYYLDEDEVGYLSYLKAIKDGCFLSDVHEVNLHNHLLSFEDGYLEYEEDVLNVEKIVSLCQLEITSHVNLIPVYQCPGGLDSYTYLKELCKQGLKRIFGDSVRKVYVDRLKYELGVIKEMGFCNYFLIVWDYVKFAKDQGILVGTGRGSAAGSLVSYLLNITTIDPIRYHLLFERFLNPERITMPDIDVDFEYSRRSEVVDYCSAKYGKRHVAPIITFGTLAAKQVVHDVGRVMDLNDKVIANICRMIDPEKSLMENYQSNFQLKELLDLNISYKNMYQVAVKLEGIRKNTSVHAAGIVMSEVALDQVIPLVKNAGGFYTTGYSMEYLEDLGLLKMDFLALRTLSVIADMLDEIKEISFDDIPNDDKEAIHIFTTVNTTGIFQFESVGMKKFLNKFRPTSFEDVVAALALFRPGPMHNIDSYIARKKGKEEISYLHPDLKPILESTYGIIVYQEQIMQIAHVMAGYSYAEADVLRRAMSKKKESVLLKERDHFIRKSVENGYTREVAEEVYDLILKFASYGFNRAHSVAYGMIAYRMAYLKAHYPNFFLRHLLSKSMGSEVKTKEYIYEAKLNEILVLPPDINQSTSVYVTEGDGIRLPFQVIKGVGGMVTDVILKERKNGSFQDIFDFACRCYGKVVNAAVMESMIYAGVFDCFDGTKKAMIESLDLILNYAEVGKEMDEEFWLKPELLDVSEYSMRELMSKELEVYGFYLSNHPVAEYRLKNSSYVPIQSLSDYFDRFVQVVMMVERIKGIETKKGEKMGFINGSDEMLSIDVVLFPRAFTKYGDVHVGDIICVRGKVEKRFDQLQIMATEIVVLEP